MGHDELVPSGHPHKDCIGKKIQNPNDFDYLRTTLNHLNSKALSHKILTNKNSSFLKSKCI